MNSRAKAVLLRITLAIISAVVVLGGAGGVSKGQTSKWTDPLALSSAESFSWFPDIVADPYGNLHVVWASGVVGYDSVMYTTSSDGLKWRTPNDIFANPQVGSNSGATRPALLVDRNSNLDISFIDPNLVYFSQVPLWDASYALSWSPRVTMSDDSQTSYFSRLAIDSQDRLHLVYTQNVPSNACSNCYHVFYRQSLDSGKTWTDPIDIVNDQIGAVKPQILIDKKDNIHIVWETGLGGGLGQLTDPTSVSYAASYNGGMTFTQPISFPLAADEIAKNITIGLDKNNHLVVAWWLLPLDLIQYQISSDDGRSWSDPVPIPDVWGPAEVYKSNLDDYAMANDSSGNLHLVAVARVSPGQKNLNVIDVVWDGTQWATPDVVATYQGDVPEWPRIAINKGNQLNVVWFVRDEAHIWESDKGRYRVWYSQGYANAPAQRVQPTPSITPTLEETPTAVITGTSEALLESMDETIEPTIILTDQSPPVDVPLTETDYIPLLLKALLPSILFVFGIVVVALMRRR